MKLRLHLTGRTPLYMHNPTHLANPLDTLHQEIKKLTSKTKKTIKDYKRISELEMKAGLYYDPLHGVILPTWNLKKAYNEGARLRKFGKMIERGFIPLEAVTPLIYPESDEASTPDEIWEAGLWKVDTMGQGRVRISRTRPFFEVWGVQFEAEMDEEQLNMTNFEQLVEDTGSLIGLGDSRNMGFGRFDTEIVEI